MRRILLVEDYKPLASLRSDFLARHGYQVVCAHDGNRAQQLLEAESFHLVITDSALPKRSGWEVARFAKKLGVPVILSSGWPVRMPPEQVAACGVDFLCPKPCSLNQLLRLIERAIQPTRQSPGRREIGTPDSVPKP